MQSCLKITQTIKLNHFMVCIYTIKFAQKSPGNKPGLFSKKKYIFIAKLSDKHILSLELCFSKFP